jgi:hypothetical protein
MHPQTISLFSWIVRHTHKTIRRNTQTQSPKNPLFGNNSLDCMKAHLDSLPCLNISEYNINPLNLSSKLSIFGSWDLYLFIVQFHQVPWAISIPSTLSLSCRYNRKWGTHMSCHDLQQWPGHHDRQAPLLLNPILDTHYLSPLYDCTSC